MTDLSQFSSWDVSEHGSGIYWFSVSGGTAFEAYVDTSLLSQPMVIPYHPYIASASTQVQYPTQDTTASGTVGLDSGYYAPYIGAMVRAYCPNSGSFYFGHHGTSATSLASASALEYVSWRPKGNPAYWTGDRIAAMLGGYQGHGTYQNTIWDQAGSEGAFYYPTSHPWTGHYLLQAGKGSAYNSALWFEFGPTGHGTDWNSAHPYRVWGSGDGSCCSMPANQYYGWLGLTGCS